MDDSGGETVTFTSFPAECHPGVRHNDGGDTGGRTSIVNVSGV